MERTKVAGDFFQKVAGDFDPVLKCLKSLAGLDHEPGDFRT